VPSRFYTHTATVLFARAPTLAAVGGVLPASERRIVRPSAEAPWFGQEDRLVTIDPAHNGRLAIDVVAAPWPDGMGDPKRDPHLFGAWAMGAFGAQTFPGALERACQQAWGDREAAAVARDHAAFVRLRTTYAIGASDDAPVVPDGQSDETDLGAITAHALRVLTLDHALAYFDPEGEVLLSGDRLAFLLDVAVEEKRFPIDVHTNVRLFRVDETQSLFDSVGMERFDLPDLEVPFANDAIDENDVARFVRNVCLYHFDRGEPIGDGETIDGPGGRYRARTVEHGAAPPPRSPLRLELEPA
jgi:hypothetical protein